MTPAPNWISMFPDEVWELIFSLLPDGGGVDRNAASVACRSWYRIDRRSRRSLFVGNCYAVGPSAAVARFPEVRAVTIKGKPHFADFNLVPRDWGAGAATWVAAMAGAWPQLEEIRFKRMVVDDEVLEMIAKSFKNLKVIALKSCEGFSTAGLASIAANCRNLRELDLQENEVEDNCCHWLSHFPESFTSLVTLNIACLEGEVNVSVLERLVSRCPNLRTLRLNHAVPLDRLACLLRRAPQIVDLGTGRFAADLPLTSTHRRRHPLPLPRPNFRPQFISPSKPPLVLDSATNEISTPHLPRRRRLRISRSQPSPSSRHTLAAVASDANEIFTLPQI